MRGGFNMSQKILDESTKPSQYFLDKNLAAGHFQENQKKLSKNEGDDAHVCNILTKYFMYILSMLKFVIACLFSKRLKKLQKYNHFSDPSTEI